jgi:hypothetical protein
MRYPPSAAVPAPLPSLYHLLYTNALYTSCFTPMLFPPSHPTLMLCTLLCTMICTMLCTPTPTQHTHIPRALTPSGRCCYHVPLGRQSEDWVRAVGNAVASDAAGNRTSATGQQQQHQQRKYPQLRVGTDVRVECMRTFGTESLSGGAGGGGAESAKAVGGGKQHEKRSKKYDAVAAAARADRETTHR